MRSKFHSLLLPIAFFALATIVSVGSQAQSDGWRVTESKVVGSKVYLDLDLRLLEDQLDSLHNGVSGASSSTWGDVLTNGGNPGMDVNFGGYDALGLEDVTAAGTLTGDSLVLNKDASITGRLNVTSIATMSDSLKVSGFVEFGDSLQVVKAVTIGETLYVTGLTSLGDSLHVAGNVDIDALLNVDGAGTFGSTLTVSGETTLNDSLHVNSGANITGTLYADSVSVADVINGQVSSLANHDTDDLSEGSTNLYFTDARARAAISEGTGVTITNGQIAIGQAVSTTSDVTFDELYADSVQATGTLAVTGFTTLNDSLHVNSGADINATLYADSISTPGLNVTENFTFTDGMQGAGKVLTSDANGSAYWATASGGGATYTAGTGVDLANDVISIGQVVSTTSDVTFDEIYADSLQASGTLTVTGITTLNDSLHVNSGANITGTLYADSISVTDVIDGQVSSLGNHDTDDLAEGSTNLYLTSSERDAIAAMAHAIDSLSCTWMKHQGVVYELILIGDQCWFAENLRSENYADGTPIPGSLSNAEWTSTTSGAQTIYDNNDDNLAIYGRLYNWYAVDDARGLCPSGWHVPTDGEWTELTDFLGGSSVAGNSMKSSPSDSPAWDGTNVSGFSALPGGLRFYNDGIFYDEGNVGYWWSASPYATSSAWYRNLNSVHDYVSRYSNLARNGFSVRCVRD